MELIKFTNKIKDDIKEALIYNLVNRTKDYVLYYESQEMKEDEEIYSIIQLKLKHFEIDLNQAWQDNKDDISLVLKKYEINTLNNKSKAANGELTDIDYENKEFYIIEYCLHLFSLEFEKEIEDIKLSALEEMDQEDFYL